LPACRARNASQARLAMARPPLTEPKAMSGAAGGPTPEAVGNGGQEF